MTNSTPPRPQAGRTLEAFQRLQVETASPTGLVVMLYDGAIRFCGQAIDAMHAKDYEEKNTNLVKVQRIVSELLSSLNRSAGGEVAENLARLYVYMLDQLVEANLKDRVALVRRVQKMLQELRASWEQLDRLAPAARVGLPLAPDTGDAANSAASPRLEERCA